MIRTMSVVAALALALTPTFASANSKTYNFIGWFSDEPSVAQGEYAAASDVAAKVCPSYGSWSDSFQPFSYTRMQPFIGPDSYSASNIKFSVTCTWQQVSQTFSDAWFSDYGSVQDGENAIESSLRNSACGGGNHQLTNIQFNPFSYTRMHPFIGSDSYSASGISGSFTCDT